MKAAVYYAKGDLRVEDVAIPLPRAGEARVKVRYCGVCGTDHHIFHGDGGAAPVPAGTIIGHEFSGVVDALGEGCARLRVGERVSVDPNDWCGTCFNCLNGKAHFCERMKGYGTTYPGGFAEYVCVPEKQVYRLPDALSFEAGSQSETLSCCVNGIDLCEIRAGSSVFILGAGPIGLMMLQLARQAGAAKIIVAELRPEKRALALKLGADVAFDPRERDPIEALRESCENVDCVIEAAGTIPTTELALRCAGKKCTVMLFGLVPPEAEISVKPFSIFQRELKIVSSFINPYTFSRAIALLAQKRVVLDDIITDIVPLSEIGRVFTDPALRGRGKILIDTEA